MENWSNLAQTLGVATMGLVALGLGVWRVTKWVGKELVLPVRDLIVCLGAALVRIEASLARIESNQPLARNRNHRDHRDL